MTTATEKKTVDTKWQTTSVFNKNEESLVCGKRRALNEGGASSSKTYSILQVLIHVADHTKNLVISIVSESLPHLKKGCIKDFFNILGESSDFNPSYNKTEHKYTFPNGSYIEFFGADEIGRVKGPRRNILFINEGNYIPWETVRHLDTRTKNFTFVDWNPASEFWAHEFWKKGEPTNHKKFEFTNGYSEEYGENVFIHSTYLDAKSVLSQTEIDNIECYKDTDPNWWNIYGLGLIGSVEELVYPKYEVIEFLPPGDYTYGLDFGFSNDQCALTRNIITFDSIFSEQLIYEKYLNNKDLSKRMAELGMIKGGAVIWADSAEPKSIDELKGDGWNIKPVEKTSGSSKITSVEWGHQKVRQLKQYWTKDSTDAIKEQKNFRYIKDKLSGIITEKTTHAWSNLMDSRRYAVMQAKRTHSGIRTRRTLRF